MSKFLQELGLSVGDTVNMSVVIKQLDNSLYPIEVSFLDVNDEDFNVWLSEDVFIKSRSLADPELHKQVIKQQIEKLTKQLEELK